MYSCSKHLKTEAYYIKQTRYLNDPSEKPAYDRCCTSFTSNSALTKHITLYDWNISAFATFSHLLVVKDDSLSSRLLMSYS